MSQEAEKVSGPRHAERGNVGSGKDNLLCNARRASGVFRVARKTDLTLNDASL